MFKSFSDITNLVFPKVCPGCNRPLVKEEEELCIHCLVDLPIRLHLKSNELMQRFYGRVPLTEAHAFLFFKRKGITQKLLHEIKYNGNQKLAIDLGKTFGENCVKERLFQSIDLIIPVPLHKSKYRLRGYNQSELIAMGMADKLGAELDTAAVVRSVKTSTQTKKSRSERWKNVSEIFKANTNRLKGRHVLVVDDVVTTGATLESCAQSILDAGALDVSIACLALA